MNDIYKDNFKTSLSYAQKLFIWSNMVSIFIFTLVGKELDDKITIPFFSYTIAATSGMKIVLALYMVFGFLLVFSLKAASDNLKNISDNKLKEALLLSPSVFTGHVVLRILAVILSLIVMVKSTFDLFGGDLSTALLVSGIFSIGHIIAIYFVIKIQA